MAEIACPGLPAEWVNAWLAAVGATRLEPRLRLHWTTDATPHAVLIADDADPVELLASAWPTVESLEDLALAETWGRPPLQRKVPVETFQKRVRAARSEASAWTISSTLTDLDVSEDGEVAHAPFDPAGPGPTKWLHHRLGKVHEHVNTSAGVQLTDSLCGTASRVKDNGLGFDIRRIASLADKTAKWVDPVVEVLAFFGLALLPVRGSGSDRSINKSARVSALQRGWKRFPAGSNRIEPRFVWPAWSRPLDFDGIDALMDIWKWRDRSRWASVGVHGGWRTVKYTSRGSGDTTRAFGSEPL